MGGWLRESWYLDHLWVGGEGVMSFFFFSLRVDAEKIFACDKKPRGCASSGASWYVPGSCQKMATAQNENKNRNATDS